MPSSLTVAISGAVDDQVTWTLFTLLELAESCLSSFTVSMMLPPCAIAILVGEVSTFSLNVLFTEVLPLDAATVIVTEPVFTP